MLSHTAVLHAPRGIVFDWSGTLVKETLQQNLGSSGPRYEIMTSPLPEACPLLCFLKERMPVGIVSNKPGPSLRKAIKTLQWSAFLDAAIGAGDTLEKKPSAQPLLLCLKHLNLTPGKHVWFVGDSLSDILCAQNAGCQPILIGPKPCTQKPCLTPVFFTSLRMIRMQIQASESTAP